MVAGRADVQTVNLELSILSGMQVACRPERLRQLLINLFSNALQAVLAEGTVSATVTEGRGMVTLKVQDSGAGFSEEAMKRAFDPFYTTRPRGSGLGLAVCRGVLRGLEGDIRFIGAPPLSRIEVTLPLAAPDAEEAVAGENGGTASPLTLLAVEPDQAVARRLLALVAERGLEQIGDEDALRAAVRAAIAANPDQVASYRAGKTTVLQWLLGQVMKATGGKANPQTVRKLLEEELERG